MDTAFCKVVDAAAGSVEWKLLQPDNPSEGSKPALQVCETRLLAQYSVLLIAMRAMISPGFHMVLSFFRVTMDFVKYIRVSEKSAEAGLGAEVDRPAMVLDAREISRIGVAEDPPTDGDEAPGFPRGVL